MILAIDQGTTGTTCIVFDEHGRPAGRATASSSSTFRPGWVEHDAQEIWDVTLAVAHAALDAAGEPALDGIGITNQRETVVAWDRRSGEPFHRAIVWQDRRTAGRCDELWAAGHEPLFRERTGLVVDPYFSGTKIEWLIRHGGVPAGAAFGTIDSWLAFKLTGEHVTDYRTRRARCRSTSANEPGMPSCASCSAWTPARCPSRCRAHVYGHTGARRAGAGGRIAGDQQAALYGQACHEPGRGKNTYGTGARERRPKGAGARRGPAPDHRVGVDGRVDYALEAAIFATGATVQWLRDGLGIIGAGGRDRGLAKSLDGNDGVYLVPAFTGSARRTGIPTRAGRSWVSRAAVAGPTSRARPRVDRIPDRGRGARDGGGRRRYARGAEGGRGAWATAG